MTYLLAHISPTLSRSLAIDIHTMLGNAMGYWLIHRTVTFTISKPCIYGKEKNLVEFYHVKNFTGVSCMWAHKYMYIHSYFVQVVADSTKLDGTTSCRLSRLCAYLYNIVVHGYHWCVWPLHKAWLVWLFSHCFIFLSLQQPSLDISLQNSSEPRSSWSHFLLINCKSH